MKVKRWVGGTSNAACFDLQVSDLAGLSTVAKDVGFGFPLIKCWHC